VVGGWQIWFLPLILSSGRVPELEFDGVPGVSPSYSLLYHIVIIGVGEEVCRFT
jgi:hypothetical protein